MLVRRRVVARHNMGDDDTPHMRAIGEFAYLRRGEMVRAQMPVHRRELLFRHARRVATNGRNRGGNVDHLAHQEIGSARKPLYRRTWPGIARIDDRSAGTLEAI